MTNEQMDQYKMRITQAGVGELTVIMLEVEMQWIDEAINAFENQDQEKFLDSVTKAQAVQQQLMDILNLDNSVARDVYSVFVYINKQLLHSKIKEQPLEFDRLIGMLKKYHASFIEVAKTDQEGPVMAASEKVYAGFTYGATGLVENSTGGMEFSV